MTLDDGFNLLATAPDGIKRLRELILNLAVQGKLVPQDQNDEPASELLKQIRAEKDRLIADGKIKKDKPLPAISDDEKPFELPEGWEWARLDDVGSTFIGLTYSPSDVSDSSAGIPVLRSSNIQKGKIDLGDLVRVRVDVKPQLMVEDGDLLICARNGSKALVGKAAIIRDLNEPMTFGAFMAIYKSRLNPFVDVFIQSPVFRGMLEGVSTTTINQITQNNLKTTVIAIPPLAEQSRIVAKVDELMALCDALEARGQLEVEQHARLTATLFDTLAASESAHQLQENWARFAASFDLVLDRPQAVDALEQTILQLAVRGLLVPQDPADEPASELLKQIRAEKDRLISEGKIKKEKRNPASFDDAPYELPDNWGWTTIGEISSSMGSGWSPACLAEPQATPEQWAVLKTTAVQLMEYQSWQNKLLPSNLQPRPDIEAQNGDILITRAGPRNRVGISCLVQNTPPRLMISDKIVRFHVLDGLIDPQFVVLCLNAGWSYQCLDAAKSGMAESQVNISQGDLKDIPLPLCTVAEQSRIVARVEALRALCGQLRERLAASRQTQAHLAEALVAQT